jgi:chromosome segregation ATPase
MNKELLSENYELKQKNAELEHEVDQLKYQLIPGEEDQILKSKEPSLFEYLSAKKDEIQRFERQLEQIETFMEDKDDQTNKILNEMREKCAECVCGRQKELEELSFELEEAKKRSNFIAEAHQKCKEERKQLESKIEDMAREVRDLFEFKRKKVKNAGNSRRCQHCFMLIGKSEHETCADCSSLFHSFYCVGTHLCGIPFTLNDTASLCEAER